MQLCPQCGIRWLDSPQARCCSVCALRGAALAPAAAPVSPAASWPVLAPLPDNAAVPPARPPPPPPVHAAPSSIPSTPRPKAMMVAGMEEQEEPRPLSLTQVTGMNALGFHGVPERAAGVDLSRHKLTPFEGYMLSLVDGATYADDVVAASGLSAIDAATAFMRLKELGILRFRNDHDSSAAHRGADGMLKEREPDSVAATVDAQVAQVGLTRIMESPVVATKEDHQVHLSSAEAAQARGDFREARSQALMAWVIAPDDPRVLKLREQLESPLHAASRAAVVEKLARDAERRLDPATAAKWYRHTLQEVEAAPDIHHRLALCILQAGLGADDAERHLMRTLELRADHAGALRLLERLRSLRGG